MPTWLTTTHVYHVSGAVSKVEKTTTVEAAAADAPTPNHLPLRWRDAEQAAALPA
eukprot:SAG31_NODE_34064_length_337_cov_0.634454_1_plen_54_part_10